MSWRLESGHEANEHKTPKTAPKTGRKCCLDRCQTMVGSKGTLRYLSTGLVRTWNFTTFGIVPLPPSWCHGVYIE